MVRRSLKASEKGVELARKALIEKGITQQELADKDLVSCHRQTVSKFFNQKPIDRRIFSGICDVLNLNLKEIAQVFQDNISQIEIDEKDEYTDILIKKIRDKIRPDILQMCGSMKILDMSQPIGINDIYTNVNVLESLTASRRLGIQDLEKLCDYDSQSFDRFKFGNITEQSVSGLTVVKRYPKLMVWGKPGAGKTTFFKYLAIYCISEKIFNNKIPIFITLKKYAEEDQELTIYEYIKNYLKKLGLSYEDVDKLLKYGRAIILFDGLDEVKDNDTNRVLKEIDLFCNQFFLSEEFKNKQLKYVEERKNRFNQLKKEERDLQNNKLYRSKFYKEEVQKNPELWAKNLLKGESYNQEKEGLQEYWEIVKKIELQLSSEGYPDISRHYDQGLSFLSKKFPETNLSNHFLISCRIAAKEYTFQGFTEVEVADFNEKQINIFVNKWFGLKNDFKSSEFLKKIDDNETVKELATNPLLLTLLCLVFEETIDLPTNRAELYKEGLDILLKKWDATRDIERDKVYKKLSFKRKEDLLSKIAFNNFEKNNYFFKQEKIEKEILKYIQNLTNSKKSKTLALDSESILKSIESQHGILVERAKGIYSFSHLTFQEYFTAKKIVSISNPKKLNISLQNLACKITKKRYREVFLLSVEMLEDAEFLLCLMKSSIDNIVSENIKIQRLITDISNHSKVINKEYSPEFIRIFYFVINLIIIDIDSNNYNKDIIGRIFKYNNLLIYKNYSMYKLIEKKVKSNFIYEKNITIIDLYIELIKLLDLKNKINRTRNIIDKLSLSTLFIEKLDNMIFISNKLNIDVSLEKKLSDLKFKYTDKYAHNEQYIINFPLKNKDKLEKLVKEVRDIIIKYYNFGILYKFDNKEKEILSHYYNANLLLLECLNSDCYIEKKVRDKIEETMLLPNSKNENIN